jgi:8-oxo-dGTP diphosphatase
MAPDVQSVNPIRFFNPLDSTPVGYTFAIIASRYQGQWIWVKHKERSTWELPAGHVEIGETPDEAARRELFEETGALEYQIEPVIAYEGTFEDRQVFGMIFLAEVIKIGPLPGFEIGEIKLFEEIPESLTYPDIQPVFQNFVIAWLREKKN